MRHFLVGWVVVMTITLSPIATGQMEMVEDETTKKLSNAFKKTKQTFSDTVGKIEEMLTGDDMASLLKASDEALLRVEGEPENLKETLDFLSAVNNVIGVLVKKHEEMKALDLVNKQDKMKELCEELKLKIQQFENQVREEAKKEKLEVHQKMGMEHADQLRNIVLGYASMQEDILSIPIGDSKDLIEGNLRYLRRIQKGLGYIKQYAEVMHDHQTTLQDLKRYHKSVLALHEMLQTYAQTLYDHKFFDEDETQGRVD